MSLPAELLRQLLRSSDDPSHLSLVNRRDEAIRHLKNIDHVLEPISYEMFFRRYLIPNIPCVLSKWSTVKWRSRSEWFSNDRISWKNLKQLFGDAVAPVANCSEQQSYSQAKTDMKLKDFIEYMEQSCNGQSQDRNCPLLYLKDWHFTRDFPAYEAYETPEYFLSDWLNEFWEDNRTNRCDDDDDYRFVYIGPQGSWTPFHSDVFASFSWSANVCGRKRWILYAPGSENGLRDKFGHLPFDLDQISDDQLTLSSSNSVEMRFELIQESGEIVFIPSGWHHQVYNLEDTISINHNWINACNIDICWSYIKQRLREVEKEIAEHRQMENWHKHCQLILRADCGMDYTDFFNLLFTVAKNRIKLLQNHQTQSKNARTADQSGPVITTQNQSCSCCTTSDRTGKSCRNRNSDDGRACKTGSIQEELLPENKKKRIGETVAELNPQSSTARSLQHVWQRDAKHQRTDGGMRRFFDIMGIDHALFDLLRINFLLERDFISKEFTEFLDDRILCRPADLLSRTKSVISSYAECDSCDKFEDCR